MSSAAKSDSLLHNGPPLSWMNPGQKTTGQKTTENANPGQKTTRTKDHQDGFSVEKS